MVFCIRIIGISCSKRFSLDWGLKIMFLDIWAFSLKIKS